MQLGTRTLSALAILVYLAAALPPCELPERLRVASAQLHSVVDSPLQPPARFSHGEHAVRDRHSHDPSRSDHAVSGEPGHHQSPLTHSVAHASSSHASSHHYSKSDKGRVSPAHQQVHRNDPMVDGLVFTAPCVCGCGDTRAAVSGGASRLGSAVPGQHVAKLLSIGVERASRPEPGRFVLQVLEIDPIPI